MQGLLEKIEKYLIYAIVLLFPITVFSVSPNPFVPAKLYVLTFGIALVLLVKALRIVTTGKLELSTSKFDFPVLLIAVAYLVSAIFRTPNIMEALLLPGTATIVIAGALLYFLINQLETNARGKVASYLIASGSLFSLITILAFLKLFSKIPQLPLFIRVDTFNPEGGFLPAAIFMLALLPLTISYLVKTKDAGKKFLYAAGSFLLFIALAISVYRILPGQPFALRFPSVSSSWSIAVDSLKESPLFGVGPGNYLTAYNRFRPLSINNTELWAVKYQTANDFYLTLLTEAGMVGFAGIVLLLLSVYRTLRTDLKEKKLVGWGFAGNAALISLALLLILAVFFPLSLTTTVLLFLLLSLAGQTKRTSVNLSTQAVENGSSVGSKIPAILVSLPILAVVIAFAYFGANVVRAEVMFQKAIQALAQNDGGRTYNLMQQAININPRVDRYRVAYSRVNIALADSIAQQQDITDQARTNIGQLVQQAIREGKNGVALNPFRAGNWDSLARIYRSIIPLANGAGDFSIQTFRQAVALDPYNPNLRISLGGVYYQTGDYESAARVFEQAIAAKSDLANSHYNLSLTYSQLGQYDKAIEQMTVVLSLVDRDSDDYQTAVDALENLQQEKKATAGQSNNLTPPEEGQEPVLQPPLDLPEDTQPPENPVSPTPTPAEGETSPTTTTTPTP